MFATYRPSFYSDGTQKDNRPVSIHRTLYGARQASKERKLCWGRLIPERTCRHHTGISLGQYQLSTQCQGEPSQYCEFARVVPLQ
jgi:hypothetical protein